MENVSCEVWLQILFGRVQIVRRVARDRLCLPVVTLFPRAGAFVDLWSSVLIGPYCWEYLLNKVNPMWPIDGANWTRTYLS